MGLRATAYAVNNSHTHDLTLTFCIISISISISNLLTIFPFSIFVFFQSRSRRCSSGGLPSHFSDQLDFPVVVLNLLMWSAIFSGGNSVATLRLIRLACLGKLFKKTPPLLMIMKGHSYTRVLTSYSYPSTSSHMYLSI